jgi:flagellar biosynthetic protein FliR
MNSFDIPIRQLHSFLFLLSRCSGIFIFTPFLGNFLVPVPVRILLSVAVSFLFSLAASTPEVPLALTMPSLAIGLGGELAVGMVLGFAAHTVFAGLQYAGQLLGFQMGLSYVNSVDPQTSNRSTTLSIYENYLGMMLFLGFNGHHWFIEAIGKSLSVLPPFSMKFSGSFVAHITAMLGKIFVIGFQIAAPLLAVLILTDVVLAMIGRSAPQVHIMIIGFPLKVLVGISGMGLTLYFFPVAMRNFTAQLFREMMRLLPLMRAS